MAKVRTLDEMQEVLDREMAWRIKEIDVFKQGARSSGPQRNPYIRAGIALLYAHWEGFIKNSSETYLEYVENRRLPYRRLKSCFVVFGLKKKLDELTKSRKSQPNMEAIDFILEKMDETAKLQISSAVNTESNLDSRVFENIARSLDIDTTPYETSFNLIDSRLVKRRNEIAHGGHRDLDIEGADFDELADNVLGLMRQYKTDILNAAALGHYRRAA